MSYKRWLFIAAGLFLLGMLLGLFMPATVSSKLTRDQLEMLRGLGQVLQPFTITMALFVFFKNVTALIFSFVFSPFLLLFPIIALTLNGWFLSFVAVSVVQETSLGFLIAGILPHGIFEIPAIVIGEAAALSFGSFAIMCLFSKEKRVKFVPHLKQNLKYLLLAAAFLLPAAIIETYITPLFLT